jgi:hypothetical protein
MPRKKHRKRRTLSIERLEGRLALAVGSGEWGVESAELITVNSSPSTLRPPLASDACRPPYVLPLTPSGGKRPAIDARGCRTNVYPQFNVVPDRVTHRNVPAGFTCASPVLAFGHAKYGGLKLLPRAQCAALIDRSPSNFPNQNDFLASTPRPTRVTSGQQPVAREEAPRLATGHRELATLPPAAVDIVLSENSPLHPSKRGRYARSGQWGSG